MSGHAEQQFELSVGETPEFSAQTGRLMRLLMRGGAGMRL
jgi:hypothetical protein